MEEYILMYFVEICFESRTSPELCPMANFGINALRSSGLVTIVLVLHIQRVKR
jgi:hypothetical protein